MQDVLLANEPLLRIVLLPGLFIALAVWEVAAPRRRHAIPRLLRWTNNLAIVALNVFLVRVVFPFIAVGLALRAEEQGWGVLHQFETPGWLALMASVLVFDLAIYLQHVMFHAVPVLWRLHRMHHADLEFDVTTGLRFHPIEILLSMVIKLGVVVALGPPAVAVLVFELLLTSTAMFNHSNIRMPVGLDRVLRRIVVTPDMHRVHHSIDPNERNSNFGFNLPWWDRLLGTYLAQPGAGHAGMTIGIMQFRTHRDLWLDRLLIQPWRGPVPSNLKGEDQPRDDDDHQDNPNRRRQAF